MANAVRPRGPITGTNYQVLSKDVARWLGDLFDSFVFTGISASAGAGLTLNLAAGRCMIRDSTPGELYEVERDAQSLTMTDAATNHIWLQLDAADGGGRRTTASIVQNTTGTAPTEPNIKLAEVVTSGGSISTVTDKRTLVAIIAGSKGLRVTGGVRTKTKAGVPADSDFDNAEDGILSVDTTNHDLYFRSGATHRKAAPVTSVFTRTGAIVAAYADYKMKEIEMGGVGAQFAAGNQALAFHWGAMTGNPDNTTFFDNVKDGTGTITKLSAGGYFLQPSATTSNRAIWVSHGQFNASKLVTGSVATWYRDRLLNTTQVREWYYLSNGNPSAAEPPVEPANIVGFRSVSATSQGNLFSITRNAGTETTTDLATTVGNLLVAKKISTGWEFYLNGTLKATHTTNLPGDFNGYTLLIGAQTREAATKELDFGGMSLQIVT